MTRNAGSNGRSACSCTASLRDAATTFPDTGTYSDLVGTSRTGADNTGEFDVATLGKGRMMFKFRPLHPYLIHVFSLLDQPLW